MAVRKSQVRIQKIKESLLQLTTVEVLEIDKVIPERLETESMMKLAESAFEEWEDPEEDIYNKRQRSGVSFHGVIYAHQLRVSIGACIRDLEITVFTPLMAFVDS